MANEYTRVTHSFLNPLQELELKEAVDKKRKKFSTDKYDFLIDYHGKQVWLHPTKGLVPCGWFAIERLGEFNDL